MVGDRLDTDIEGARAAGLRLAAGAHRRDRAGRAGGRAPGAAADVPRPRPRRPARAPSRRPSVDDDGRRPGRLAGRGRTTAGSSSTATGSPATGGGWWPPPRGATSTSTATGARRRRTRRAAARSGAARRGSLAAMSDDPELARATPSRRRDGPSGSAPASTGWTPWSSTSRASAERPVEEHVAVFERAHEQLRRALDATRHAAGARHLRRPEPAVPPRRLRLDAELVRRGLARSREHASELIAAGRVKVSGALATKPATGVTTDVAIVVARGPRPPRLRLPGRAQARRRAGGVRRRGARGRGPPVPGRRRLDRRLHRRAAARRRRRGRRRRRRLRPAGLEAAAGRAGRGARPHQRPRAHPRADRRTRRRRRGRPLLHLPASSCWTPCSGSAPRTATWR